MLFEIGSSVVMAGVAGWAYLKTNGPATNDAEKIQRIFNNSGLKIKEGTRTRTIRLVRKKEMKDGMEYVFQLPLGMSSKMVVDQKQTLEDGLNIRQSHLEFDPVDILKIKWDRTAIKQIKKILTNKKITRKEIDITFDGMLKIRVFNAPLTDNLTWDDQYLKYGGWMIPVGQTRTDFIYHDFKKTPHVIVAGTTGMGKSQFLKMMITSLIMIQPDHVHFTLIDLKGGTAFQRFKDLKQVERYGRNPTEAKEILEEVQTEMNKKLDHIVSNGYEDTEEAGIPDRHFIIVDESADMAGNSVCMDIVADIARRGRGAAFHLIYCTQYPTNETIPSQVRPNIGARVCFQLKTNIQSRAVLDEGGAEELPEIPGRGIYQLNKNVVIQTPYIKNKEIETRIQPHINFKPRKDGDDGQKSSKTTTDRKHSFKFEKV